MKKLIALTLCAIMTLSLSAFAAEPMLTASAPEAQSQPGYTLQIDGEDTGIRACIMVPLRAVAEQQGFEVVWNGDGTIFLDNGVMHSTITVGRDLYQVVTSRPGLVGMSAPFSLGMAPYVIDGVTYVPLGLFDALLGSRKGAVTLEDDVICLNTKEQSADDVQIPNPFAEYETPEAAAEAAGFNLAAPQTVNGADRRVFRTISGELLEVIYRKGEDETARVRKAPGAGDISGDYTVYPQVGAVVVGGIEVTFKGEDGKVSLATWSAEGYTCAISVEGGVSSADMIQLVYCIR